MSDWDKAEGAFIAALKVNPKNAMAHVNIGIIYLQRGMPEKAISEWKKSIELDNDWEASSKAYNNIGYSLSLKKNYDEAIKNYSQALRYDDTDENTHVNLTLAYEQKGLKDAAVKELNAVLKFNPNSQWAKEKLALLTKGK